MTDLVVTVVKAGSPYLVLYFINCDCDFIDCHIQLHVVSGPQHKNNCGNSWVIIIKTHLTL